MANKRSIPNVYVPLVGALLKHFASEDTDGRLSQYNIGKLRNYGCNPGIARPGLDWLTANAILEELIETDERDRWRVWQFTSEGAQFADVLFDVNGDQRSYSIETNETWEPLELERSLQLEIVSAVGELYERVRGDNEFAERQPSVHKGVTDSIKSGFHLLKEGVFTKSQLYSLIVTPSAWLAAKFAGAAIGELAKRVVDLLSWIK